MTHSTPHQHMMVGCVVGPGWRLFVMFLLLCLFHSHLSWQHGGLPRRLTIVHQSALVSLWTVPTTLGMLNMGYCLDTLLNHCVFLLVHAGGVLFASRAHVNVHGSASVTHNSGFDGGDQKARDNSCRQITRTGRKEESSHVKGCSF